MKGRVVVVTMGNLPKILYDCTWLRDFARFEVQLREITIKIINFCLVLKFGSYLYC
jgi:hypothetical protein